MVFITWQRYSGYLSCILSTMFVRSRSMPTGVLEIDYRMVIPTIAISNGE